MLWRRTAEKKKAPPMSMIGFPLLLIPLAIFNIIVFLMPGVSFTDPIVTVALVSKATWKVTFGDMLLALGMLLLLLEVFKAARPGGKYFTDHLLALLVFTGAAAEFVMLPQFATSVFFLLVVLTLVDFLAGVSLRPRRETSRRVRSSKADSAKVQPSEMPSSNVQPPREKISALPEAPGVDAGAVVPPMATIEPAHSVPADDTAAGQR
jgi:hypothetical protein